VEEEARALAVDLERLHALDGKGNALEALVVVADELVALDGLVRIEVVAAFGEDQPFGALPLGLFQGGAHREGVVLPVVGDGAEARGVEGGAGCGGGGEAGEQPAQRSGFDGHAKGPPVLKSDAAILHAQAPTSKDQVGARDGKGAWPF
jgi:hypothetical protein